MTPDRLLPVGLREVAGSAFDFRQLRPIGETAIVLAPGDAHRATWIVSAVG